MTIIIENNCNPIGGKKMIENGNVQCATVAANDHIVFSKIYVKLAFNSRVLSDAKGLSELPSLEGCSALEILRLDRANISVISSALCRNSSHLKSL